MSPSVILIYIDVILLDFFFWGHLKALFYAEKIQGAAQWLEDVIDALNTIIVTPLAVWPMNV